MGFFRVLGAILLAVLAIGLAGAIFQTGYLAGVAADGAVAPVVVGPGYHYGWGWGFGGGLFGILGFLFFLFLFFAIIRAAFGGGRRGGWGHGPWGGGWGRDEAGHHMTGRFGPWEERAREAHHEWHRREASGDASPGDPAGSRPSGGTNPGDAPSGGAA